jgi:cytochrome c oxidase subunit 3
MIRSASANKLKKYTHHYHPIAIFTYLILLGVSSVFLTLSISYFFTTLGSDLYRFELPVLFHANSVIILVSSYSMHQTRLANLRDDAKGFSNGIMVTTLLGIAFTIFQIIAWKQLLEQGVNLRNNVAGAYLYVISGLHLLHLIAGVVLLSYFWLKAKERENNPVAELLFDTDPNSKVKVKYLAVYWHFVDFLWIYLYLFFVLTTFLAKHGVTVSL